MGGRLTELAAERASQDTLSWSGKCKRFTNERSVAEGDMSPERETTWLNLDAAVEKTWAETSGL